MRKCLNWGRRARLRILWALRLGWVLSPISSHLKNEETVWSHSALFFYSFSTIILFSGNHFPILCIIIRKALSTGACMAFYHMQMQQGVEDRYRTISGYRIRPAEQSSHRKRTKGLESTCRAPDSTIEEVATDSSGRTPVIELKTSTSKRREPVEQQPYSEWYHSDRSRRLWTQRNRRVFRY